MRKIICAFVFWVCFTGSTSFAEKERIDGIYTEATGNNPFEAKIKAIDKAMFRAFILLADKHLVSDAALNKVPRNELKELFTDIKITQEDLRIYLSGSSYSAVIELAFSQSKMNQLIQKYASEKTKEKFLKAVVIPVFKINSIMLVDKDNRKWISSWKKAKPDLSDNKLYVTESVSDLKGKVTPQNILKMGYDDFMEIMPYKLFRSVIITVAEFFTNRQDGSTYLRVKNIIITPTSRTEESVDHSLPSDKDSVQKFIPELIDEFSKKYGEPVKQESIKDTAESENIVDILSSSEINKKDAFYTFLMEVNYSKELDEIQEKLHAIKEISRFNLESHYELGFKVKIYTDLDMMALADKLYYGGLSFYYNQFQNPVLINIQDGKK